MKNLDRFIKYVKIDTQADDTTGVTPSTEKQKDLSKVLVEELKTLGVEDAYMDEYGIVYGHIPGEGDRIGFNAHIDTALEVTDTNVKPQIIHDYDGKDFKLNEKYTLSAKEFPHLLNHLGHDLVVTDGNTLLGADDKAGIAIIMSMVEYFHEHPEVKHHPISIAFTVDEEIGEGSLHFSLEKMNADYAFTCDGANINYVDYENFNAYGVNLKVNGVAVHPGEGKNALINALLIINDFINDMPKGETPFEANEDEGYWHINSIEGSSESASLDMIIREFDNSLMEKRINGIKDTVKKLEAKYPKAKIECNIKYQYENMKPYVDKDPRAVEVANEALIKNGLTPVHTKIRGGTDGATFSKMGLVTPNLGTGSYNHHGRYEFLDIQEYQKMIDIVIDIAKIS